MSYALLERAASDLGADLLSDVVFVGAATLVLWITDEAAPPLRPTSDVDVVAEISSRLEYARFEQRLRDEGFRSDGRVICRWHHSQSGLMLDAMPTDARLLGFANRWQGVAVDHATDVSLPSGPSIRCAPPPYLLATKLEAFAGRGRDDPFGSKDFEDVIALVDGRPGLVEEVEAADEGFRQYVADQAQGLLDHRNISDALEAALPMGEGQARAAQVLEPRLRELAALRP